MLFVCVNYLNIDIFSFKDFHNQMKEPQYVFRYLVGSRFLIMRNSDALVLSQYNSMAHHLPGTNPTQKLVS